MFARGDLTSFYEETSFVPFAAMLDGRQPLTGSGGAEAAGAEGDRSWLVDEVPWAWLGGGLVAGAALESAVLRVVDSV